VNNPRSKALFAQALRYIPGGVNSPVRAFRAVGGDPLFIQRGHGSRVVDADGHEYIDYVGSWGPLILGHAHPEVVSALSEAVRSGTSFGAPTQLETTLARMVCQAVPSIESVRFVNSGTEATMSALRVARGYTCRDMVVKFEGNYHGHVDALLAKAGSGVATLGVPDSAGVPASQAQATLLAPFNDLKSVERLFQAYPAGIAAIIVEPVAANMGVVPPEPGFLEGLRRLTHQHGALLIFDEVITGFRLHFGGAQSLYGVTPDLTCLGKIIGGGLPVGAYGGREEVMNTVAPMGPVYQAGTLSGNPLAMTAGIATLGALQKEGVYEELEDKAGRLAEGLTEAAASIEVPVRLNRVGSIMTVFFTETEVVDYSTATASDNHKYASYFHAMLAAGVYLAPSQYEALFVSLAHTDRDIAATIHAATTAFSIVAGTP